MALFHSPKTSTDGLVFMYDTGNRKSYVGEPTINYIHGQNAVAKDSYNAYSATSSGTYNAKHPDAIIAYNAAGTQLSNYYNSGVTDATNTYHAHWQYDSILKKPVVVMNDVDAQWKAKWMSTGLGSWNSQGKSHGDTYTISWLQWVDHLSKNAKAGLYTKNTSDSSGFHDGQANSASSYNTKLRTWQRVYQTYTTNSVRDLSRTLASIYMYGHYNVRATVKIADVQFTWGDHPVQFSAEYERTATQGLIDRTGNTTIDLSNVSFDSNAQMTFDGTDDYIDLGDLGLGSGPFTVEAVIYPTLASTYHVFFRKGDDSTSNTNMDWSMGYDYNQFHVRTQNASVSINEYAGANFVNNYGHVALTYDGSTIRMYVNGSEVSNRTVTLANNYSNYSIGRGINNYAQLDVNTLKVYNQVLTSTEVTKNFNAIRSRFGL